MKTYRLIATARPLVAALALVTGVQAAPTNLASEPLTAASQTSKTWPNILFVLDDSASMALDHLPDWADPNNRITVPKSFPEQRIRNPGFNGIAYNPRIRYRPPSYFKDDGTDDVTTYKSQTSENTRGWEQVIDNAYDNSSKSNLKSAAYAFYNADRNKYCTDEAWTDCQAAGPASYYTTLAGEYCTNRTLMDCKAGQGNTDYPIAAPLRWCNSQAAADAADPSASPAKGNCRATQTDSVFKFPRMPEPQTSLVSSEAGGSVDSIKVDSQEILSKTIPLKGKLELAQEIAAAINACSFGLTGSCQVIGYRANTDPNNPGVVTIAAPSAFASPTTPILTQTGGVTATAFGRWGTNKAPGDVTLTVITGPDSNKFPKDLVRTDCDADACSYAQEMTNYANWWTYYRTRMQAMKTATSQAFSTITERRIGYMSTNNNGGQGFLNVVEFTDRNKKPWYDKLFSAAPGKDTPLRAALSKAGNLYAGRYNNEHLNDVAVIDPVGAYCQKNATILSTDGYWNQDAGFTVGDEAVGDQDGYRKDPERIIPRPQLDGGGQQQAQLLQDMLKKQTPLPNSQQWIKVDQPWHQFYPRTKSTTFTWYRTIMKTVTYETRRQEGVLKQKGQIRTVTQVEERLSVLGGAWTEWADKDECEVKASGDTKWQCRTRPVVTELVTDCTDKLGYELEDRFYKTDVRCVPADDWLAVPMCTDRSKCRYDWTPPVNAPFTCQDPPDFANPTPSRTCQTDEAFAAPGQCPTTDATRVCTDKPTQVVDATCNASDTACTPNFADYRVVDSCVDESPAGQTYRCGYGNLTDEPVRPGAECKVSDDQTTAKTTKCYPVEGAWNKILLTDKCEQQAPKLDPVTGLSSEYKCTDQDPDPNKGPKFVAFDQCQDEQASANNSYTTTACVPTTSQSLVDVCLPHKPSNDCAADGNDERNARICRQTTCGAFEQGNPVPDTLADVAQYYYATALRTAANLCALDANKKLPTFCVPEGATNKDGERMLTYTLGLGASGMMQYDPHYQDAQKDDGSDYASIKWPTAAAADKGICSWQPDGSTCDWPRPSDNSQNNIDDLWHAAVNGRGQYFNAGDPAAVAASIRSALADIVSTTGSAAAATVASANLVDGQNAVYEVSFEVGVWSGDVVKRNVDSDGKISTVVDWSAQEQLRKKKAADRNIYTYGPENALVSFSKAGLTEAQLTTHFGVDRVSGLWQFSADNVNRLDDAAKTPASGENLVNFLRGDSTFEGVYYRQRVSKGQHRPLGDISGSEAVFVKEPPWNYVDNQYDNFKKSDKIKDREAMLYVGANDGMLHAFSPENGEEAWAYVPSLVLARLHKLADTKYADKHQFTVDATPVVGDICADSAEECLKADNPELWKTILVGGLNNGGRGYYALDITDPTTPKQLWEFQHDQLGYTYGNPLITKLTNGTWVVIVASGYNNADPGDGKGHLFILNARSGELISKIDAGDDSDGLARIAAWANFPDINNTAEHVYGGDLSGNLWRFNINAESPSVHRLATLRDADGNKQPITTAPELGKVKNKRVVFVGTGRLLDSSDFPSPENPITFIKQSFYAIKDGLDNTDYGNPRASVKGHFTTWTLEGVDKCDPPSAFCNNQEATTTLGLTQRDGESDTVYQARLNNIVNDAFGANNDGWYIDFPGDGEQSTTDPSLQRGSIVFTTNRPLGGEACVPQAVSFRYAIDYRTGSSIEGTNGVIGVKVADSLGMKAAVLGNDDKLFGLTRTDQGPTEPAAIPTPILSEAARRVSWRELVTE